MKYITLIVFMSTALPCFGQLPDETIRGLKTEKLEGDTSYVYWLPYRQSYKYLFIQGANSKFSHRGELAFDFKMKPGSSICSVRDGEVISIKEDSDKGGLKQEYLDDGNHIMIKHEDGSIAQYWHLQQNGVLVEIGDQVEQGQAIGLSGNTGYTAFPHLHFQLIDKNGREILPRFQTRKGVRYLRPGRSYRAVTE